VVLRAERVRRIDLAVYAGAAFTLMLLRWGSGLPSRITGVPYWYLSYVEGGFIRRALIGTITTPVLVGRPLREAAVMINATCVAATLVLIATLTLLFCRSGLRLLDPLPLLFLLSGALAWLATDLSNLDVFLVLLSLWAFMLLYRNNPAGLLLCAAVPLIHEGGAFLLGPLLAGLFAFRPESRRRCAVGAAIVTLAMLALWLFSTNRFEWPAGMPAWQPELLDQFRQLQVGQHAFVFAVPAVTLDMLVFSILPALAMAFWVATRRGAPVALVVLSGTLLTWSVTLIATDVDRLMAWGPFTAVVLAGLALTSADGSGAARRIEGARG
jgi:hypothetical protein